MIVTRVRLQRSMSAAIPWATLAPRRHLLEFLSGNTTRAAGRWRQLKGSPCYRTAFGAAHTDSTTARPEIEDPGEEIIPETYNRMRDAGALRPLAGRALSIAPTGNT